MTIGWFQVRFDRAVASLGVPGVTPHTLRHSAGSLALQSGAPVVTVQKLLGHRNATTTLNVDSHLLPDDFRQSGPGNGFRCTRRSSARVNLPTAVTK